MTVLTAQPSTVPLKLDLQGIGAGIPSRDDEQFFELCRRNRDLRFERMATGEILMISPADGKTSSRNSKITRQLAEWSEHDGSGEAFDSSGGFKLPNGAVRSPDAAWIEHERLQALTEDEEERFLPLCPTSVVELRSPSDALASVEEKMREYLENGSRLGWLIDPQTRRVHVYRPGVEIKIHGEPASMSGDPELPGFVLELARIWDPGW